MSHIPRDFVFNSFNVTLPPTAIDTSGGPIIQQLLTQGLYRTTVKLSLGYSGIVPNDSGQFIPVILQIQATKYDPLPTSKNGDTLEYVFEYGFRESIQLRLMYNPAWVPTSNATLVCSVLSNRWAQGDA